MEKTKILLIGNAHSILSTTYGKIIDSYSNIARFNDFKIEGYESQVGTRTTHFITHNNAYDSCFKTVSNKKFDHAIIWGCSPESLKFNIPSHIPTECLFKATTNKILHSTPIGRKIVCPSTGCLSVTLFLTRFDHIILHGFDGFTTGHYWDMQHPHYNLHEGNAELNYYNHLKSEGKLSFLKDLI